MPENTPNAVAGPDGQAYKSRQVVFQTVPMGGDATAGYVDPWIARMARLVTLRNKRERGEKLESDEAAFLMTETSGERDALADMGLHGAFRDQAKKVGVDIIAQTKAFAAEVGGALGGSSTYRFGAGER